MTRDIIVIVLLYAMLLFCYLANAEPPEIYSRDGTYLGNMSANTLDPNSVNNPYGVYGNPMNPYSINDTYGIYGSQFSPESVNNLYVFPEVETENVLEDFID